ncbi:MAG: phenylalanine--tRNA ligase subunit beta [Phycisphaerales bacterium]|nr:phenylalanine--tRNA ligase subunit beta [Phycisphaerales bacterium]
MRTSITWINDYLDPPADEAEQAAFLTAAGFPDEGADAAENGERWQEVEMTSNRGDCLCHLGLAREIAVISGRKVREPAFSLEASGPRVEDAISVRNTETMACPIYTARVIRGVTVKESPDWLKKRIEAIGLVPRNNLVDATNFVLFEYGQPTHIFDLAKIEGQEIQIRWAKAGERMQPIGEDESELKLTESDLVIADASRPVALAGVKGGAETAVTGETTDVLLEAASFDPVVVRNASRRHQVASDSSYRFERGVHPADVAHPANRLAALVLELAGGELAEGACVDGQPIPPTRTVNIRPDRCRAVLGLDLPDQRIAELLKGLDLDPTPNGDRMTCTIPPRRIDLEREIDLIEEVARTNGLDALPVEDVVRIRPVPPQPVESALRAIRTGLVGMGFVETTTHTLVGAEAARPFLEAGRGTLDVDDDRAGAEPTLRPSVIPSLLRVARHNHDAGTQEVRLFETAAIFDTDESGHRERQVLAMVADAPLDDDDPQVAYGVVRAAVERAIEIAGGSKVQIESVDPTAIAPRGIVSIEGRPVGEVGILNAPVLKQFGLDRPIGCAELELAPDGIADLLAVWPPESHARALPAFPSIDRDLSVVLPEDTRWSAIESAVTSASPAMLEALEFRTVYRGKQLAPGRKSLTFRLRFRADDRTLRHEEVDPQVAAVRSALEQDLGGEVRD